MNLRHVLMVSFLALACRPLAADELTSLEGKPLKGTIQAIDADGKLAGENLPEGLTLDMLRRIERSPEAARPRTQVVLDLVHGGRLQAEGLSMADEKFRAEWSLGEPVVLPLDVVRTVRFRPSAKNDVFEAALKQPSADNDRVFVEVDNTLTVLPGLVESIADNKVTFEYEGASQTLPTDRVFGVILAQLESDKRPAEGVTVELVEGSQFSGTVQSLADGKLTLDVGPASVALPWPSVKSMTVRSSRLAFLSDLEPAEVEEFPLVTLPRPWQRDKNVAGKPLMIGERSFERGLGTHAYSRLVFDLGGQYDVFSAVVGLDAAAGGKGDCEFVVLGDGRELARQRMTGSSQPTELKVDIAGIKQLSLVVEPGADLDLADWANWADARVIKQK